MEASEILLLEPGAEARLRSVVADLERIGPDQNVGFVTQGYKTSIPVSGLEIANGFAYLPLRGILCRGFPAWVTDYGLCRCEDIEAAAEIVGNDPGIHTLILGIHSPGGMATGTPEAAGRIMALGDTGTRTVAYIDHLGASGAYWLACSCHEIFMFPSGRAGSIGCVSAFYDVSGMLDREGVRLEAFTSAEGKLRAMPGRATTEEDRRYFQGSVDRWGDRFRQHVRSRRDVDDAVWSGDTWDGPDSVALGLVDGLATDLGAVLAALEG